MLAKVLSGAVVGLDARRVTVEVDIASKGLPLFSIVGLPDKAVEESRERVRAAIKNSGAEFPAKRITVNLAPADLPKIGPSYDLPIAVGILTASGQMDLKEDAALYMGELSLDGTLRHTNGILPIALFAKSEGIRHLYVPHVDATEAAILSGIGVYGVESLAALYRHASGVVRIKRQARVRFQQHRRSLSRGFDMADIRGQEQAKRVLEIAAAGGHNLFMQGVPGAGKTMMARALPSILPTLTEEEALEVTKIYSVTGNLSPGESLVRERPFRAPHHTTSRIGLIGGGTKPMPGEISLAHRGVLFLDEFPEFPRHVLESLRQPMEDGIVTISRAAGTVTYPATFTLVAASNPCPCGNFGSENKQCTCLPGQIARYQKRVSGPILDRIDLHISVPAVKVEKLTARGEASSESSDVVQKRVQRARNRQRARFSSSAIQSNAELTTKLIKRYIPLSDEAHSFLRRAVSQLGLTARSYYRVIKVSRTIADIEGSSDVSTQHIAEAVQYRPKE